MKFTTPCFVRVEDAEKRAELKNWLVLIGYVDKTNMSHRETIRWFADDSTDQEILATGIFILAIQSSENMETRKMIDCGSNIELFKALAARNDTNARNQWLIDPCCVWHFDPSNTTDLRKATAEEIVEHFKNKKK